MTVNRSELIKQLFDNTEAAKRSMYSQTQALLRDLPIPRALLEVLSAIKYLQPVSSKEIANRLSLTPGAVSQSVESLDQDGYIVRKADLQDRRIQHLVLSKKGEKLLGEIDKRRYGMMEEITQDLTLEELTVWLRVQTKMAARLQTAHEAKMKKETKR